MDEQQSRPTGANWLEPTAAALFLCLAFTFNRDAAWQWWWLIDVVTLLGSALAYRRPVLGAILTAAGMLAWIPFADPPASISSLAVFINIFAVVRQGHRYKVPITVGLFGLCLLTLVQLSVANEFRWDTALLLLILLSLTTGSGTLWRLAQRRLDVSQLKAEHDMLQLRASLARDLHDTIAQTLSSTVMRANLVAMDEDLGQESLVQLDHIIDECSSSAHDLRQLLTSLSDRSGQEDRVPAPRADVSTLATVVEAQAERIRSHGLLVTTSLLVDHLSVARAQTLSAVVIEAASNVIKHGRPGTSCSLRIFEVGDNTVGEIENIRTRTTDHARGMGLTGIQERLALLQGRCEIDSSGERWLLRIILPNGLVTPRVHSRR